MTAAENHCPCGASENGAVFRADGSPAMRQSTVTAIVRVIVPFGSNFVSLTPLNRPCETASTT